MMADLADGFIANFGRQMSIEVAAGVHAWVERTPDGALEIMYVEATVEGSGAVGRWLDSLRPDRRVVVPNVTSKRLAGMLQRRGFKHRHGLRPLAGLGPTWVELWVRHPTTETTDDG